MCPTNCVFCGIDEKATPEKKLERIDLFGKHTTPSFRYACRKCLDDQRNIITEALLRKEIGDFKA